MDERMYREETEAFEDLTTEEKMKVLEAYENSLEYLGKVKNLERSLSHDPEVAGLWDNWMLTFPVEDRLGKTAYPESRSYIQSLKEESNTRMKRVIKFGIVLSQTLWKEEREGLSKGKTLKDVENSLEKLESERTNRAEEWNEAMRDPVLREIWLAGAIERRQKLHAQYRKEREDEMLAMAQRQIQREKEELSEKENIKKSFREDLKAMIERHKTKR